MPRLYVRGADGTLLLDHIQLSDMFGKFGKVIRVQTGGQGFAFVEMENERDGEEAIRSLDGCTFEGNKLSVEKAKNSDRISDFRCFNCNKPGHLARDCKEKPRNPMYLDTRGTKISERGKYGDRVRTRRSPPRYHSQDRYRERGGGDYYYRGGGSGNYREPYMRSPPRYSREYDRRSPDPYYNRSPDYRYQDYRSSPPPYRTNEGAPGSGGSGYPPPPPPPTGAPPSRSPGQYARDHPPTNPPSIPPQGVPPVYEQYGRPREPGRSPPDTFVRRPGDVPLDPYSRPPEYDRGRRSPDPYRGRSPERYRGRSRSPPYRMTSGSYYQGYPPPPRGRSPERGGPYMPDDYRSQPGLPLGDKLSHNEDRSSNPS